MRPFWCAIDVSSAKNRDMTDTSRQKRLTIGIELIDDPGWMGGTLYLRNLALSLARLPEHLRPGIRLLGTQAAVSRFREESGNPAMFGAQRGEAAWARALRRLGWRGAAAEPVDIVYPGFGTEIPGAVTMRWIPDFQHRHLPGLFSAEEIEARDRSIGAIAASPGVVVLSSEVAATDFRRFFPGHRAAPHVWHFYSLIDVAEPVSAAELRMRHGIPEKYIYLPNQFWAHKNHITVLKALAILRNRRGVTIPLVCTGAQSDRRNQDHFSSLVEFMGQEGITDQVFLLGLLPRHEQVGILRCAAAVVQPSLFEGWSTVVEDARATGRPILLSDIPVHREQAPAGGLYFPPEAEEHLAALLAIKWPMLGAGPDPETESKATLEVNGLILESAKCFCEIARDALACR
jgi:hypothetical protein